MKRHAATPPPSHGAANADRTTRISSASSVGVGQQPTDPHGGKLQCKTTTSSESTHHHASTRTNSEKSEGRTLGESSCTSKHTATTASPMSSKTDQKSQKSKSATGQQHSWSTPSCSKTDYSTSSQDYGRLGIIRKGMDKLGLGSRQRSTYPSTTDVHHYHRRGVVLPRRSSECPPSLADYRNGYPSREDDPEKNDNLDFYTGKIPFKPKGAYIDVILSNWSGKYDILEDRHDYIQWLFPTQDGSRYNYHAQPLQKHEIKAICADHKANERVLKSYKMMLDFYGMKLQETGEVERNEFTYRERYAVLEKSRHNHHRITRILMSIGELGYEYLIPSFVRFVLKEVICSGLLCSTLDSCMNYWVETIRSKDDRDSLWLFAQTLVSESGTK